MNTSTLRVAALTLALGLSGAAHAALQGRDLNGSVGSFEAYYDTDLDITWLADANYAKTSGYDADGAMTWAAANTWVANLSFYNPLTNQTYADWRLPTVEPVNGSTFNSSYTTNGSTDVGYNISAPGTAFAGSTGSEMAYMFYNNLGNSGYRSPAGAVSGCPSNNCLVNVGPFTNLQPFIYWSATEYAPNTNDAWFFRTYIGDQTYGTKTWVHNAWAVSDGDIAAVPEADTWAMLLAGLGLVGAAARRRRG